MSLGWLGDRTDERVQAALTRTCGVCKAKPGRDCRHPWETSEPLGRVVHLERAQQDVDKRKADQ